MKSCVSSPTGMPLTGASGRSLLLGIALLGMALPATGQFLPRLPYGAAWRALRGPSLSLKVLKATDGSSEARFLLDRSTPGVRWRVRRIHHGLRHFLTANFSTPALGAFRVQAEVDVLGPRFYPVCWDLTARVKTSRQDLAVSALGFEFKFKDMPGEQALLIPVFSGGEFVEPADSIPVDKPVDTFVGNSMQVTAYYGDDGTGMMMFAKDPRGTTPKHFVYASGRSGQPEIKTITAAMEYVLPNSNVGGKVARTLAPTRICLYSYPRRRMAGWYPAAKFYRKWLQAHAHGEGGILEKGRLETRRDVPTWMKKLDVLVTEQYGWFPTFSVPDPLLNLVRLKAKFGAENMMVSLFFWRDLTSLLGLDGSYYPLPATTSQVQRLLKLGVRTMGYTNPGLFDIRNPFYLPKGLNTEVIEDRNGQSVLFGSTVLMDMSSKKLQEHWESLGKFHSTASAMSGFFCDAPAHAGMADWRRPAGQPVGVTESSYLGYKEVMAQIQHGAHEAKREMALSHEAAFEWLIPVASFGEGPVGIIGRAFKDEARTRGVPFFQTVYSGYTLFWPAEEGLGWETLIFVPDAFGDLTKHAISRLLAEGFTWGGIPNHSELVLNQGLLYFELPLPPVILAAFIHHGEFLKKLIQLRRAARPWMVFGEMLNSPVSGGDMVDVIVKRPFDNAFVDQTFRKPAAPTTAWRAKDGSIRLVAANGGVAPATVELDLRRIGLWRASAVQDVQTKQVFRMDRRTRKISVTVPGGTGRLLAPIVRRYH